MPPALHGIQIADFTQAHQGPWATQKLGDLGAEVIKIEPIGGSWTRNLTPGKGERIRGESAFWLSANRNKRSITLDLKSAEGTEVALDIAAESDLLIENFRPGVMDRLNLSYEDVKKVNENIVYVSASGYGSDGPYSDRPGQDLLMQGMSGIAASVGYREDPPMPVPFPVIDQHSAMQIVSYALTALFHRERTGEGQKVEVNLLNAAIDSQCQGFTVELNSDTDYHRSEEGIGQKYLGAPYGIYETQDGYIVISMVPMDELARVLEQPELAKFDSQEAVFKHRDEIKRRVESVTQELPSQELLDKLLEADLWASPVYDYEEVVNDPQVRHNDMIIEVEHPSSGTFRTTGMPGELSVSSGSIRKGPPATGEHTKEILQELDYDDDEYRELVRREVVEAEE